MTDPAPIVLRYRGGLAEVPKHARLRAAIVAAVEAGELPVGSKVAGERELSEALGLSLGTTQKALGRLVQEGFLVRRQGHGTFVGSARRPVAGSWHYRFVAAEGGPELPVFATVVGRRLVREEGPWSSALGPDPKGYAMLERVLDVDGRFACRSAMYLPATRFGRLLRAAPRRLGDVNLKALLEEEYAAPTLHSDGLARVARLDAAECALLNVPRGTWGLRIAIVGRSFGRAPITFQLMTVPPTACGLKLDFHPPLAAG